MPYGDDSNRIPCVVKQTITSWIFLAISFFVAPIGENGANCYAPNKDENAQKGY